MQASISVWFSHQSSAMASHIQSLIARTIWLWQACLFAHTDIVLDSQVDRWNKVGFTLREQVKGSTKVNLVNY